MIPKTKLEKLYRSGLSMMEISNKTKWSYHQITYWMNNYNILRRSYAEAIYIKYNPDGDPFKIKKSLTVAERELKGFGLGLYWGEGHKKSKHAVRLNNSDPGVIKLFREFLRQICSIKEEKLKYNLLLFNDANKRKAVDFWAEKLEITPKQIGSITSLKPRGNGTYKKKSMTGVLTIEFNNIKLKKEIDKMIESYK